MNLLNLQRRFSFCFYTNNLLTIAAYLFIRTHTVDVQTRYDHVRLARVACFYYFLLISSFQRIDFAILYII